MRRIVPCLLVAILAFMAFSGCLGGGSPKSVPSSSAAGPAASDGSSDTPIPSGGPGSEPGNHAPVAALAVSENGTVLSMVNGSYAVSASKNVTIDASGSSDPDADALTFAWSIDGNASQETGAFLVASLAAGNHTVTVVVSDGEDSATASALLMAKDVAVVAPIVKTFAGSFDKGAVNAASAAKAVHPFDVPVGAKKITAFLKWSAVYAGQPATAELDLALVDPKGTSQSSASTVVSFQYVTLADAAKIAGGKWTASVTATAAPAGASYSLVVIVWPLLPIEKVFTGSSVGAVNVGKGTAAEAAPITYKLVVPDGVSLVVARLAWTTGDNTWGRALNDYDLEAFVAGKSQFASGNGAAYEFGYKAAADGASLPGGEWSFVLTPFVVANADFTLTVDYL